MLGRWYAAAMVVPLAFALVCVLAVSAGAEVQETTHPVVISPGGAITSNGTLTYAFGETRITCSVSLAGSFKSGSMEFELPEELGSLTTASATGCRGGTVTLQAEARAPWHMWMHHIVGTLPAITAADIWITPAKMLVRSELLSSCLYPNGRIGGSLATTFTEGRTVRTGSLTMSETEDEWGRPTRLEGFLECTETPRVSGTLSFTTQRITTQNPLGYNFSPSNFNIVYGNSGTTFHQITFTNRTNNAIGNLEPSTITDGTRGFDVPAERDMCNGARPAGMTGTCTVEVRYRAEMGREPWFDLLKIWFNRALQGITYVTARPN